jgi:starch phosphorylase
MTNNNKNQESIFFTDSLKEEHLIKNDLLRNLEYQQVKDKTTVRPIDAFMALSSAIRNKLIKYWLRTQNEYREKNSKRVYYLSMEFLMGRLLGNMLTNLDFHQEASKIIEELGYNLEDLRELEPDMGLGNGGLGRLAACFLDSMATLGIPAYGYGIRYEYGIFHQDIINGYQVESPDNWLKYGCPWEIVRPELEYRVKFGGKVITESNGNGGVIYKWVDTKDVLALAYDVPVPGYKNNVVNNLRLWQAKSTNEFDFKDFNEGDYMAAVYDKNASETISKVLYPNDNVLSGKVLRLKQQYFFVSATLQDIIKHFKRQNSDFSQLPNKITIQLNDTHPTIAIPELMRILIDENNISWNDAWEITKQIFAYTNHTVLPEALEKWDVNILSSELPRHMQIINEINRRFVVEVRDFHGFSVEQIDRTAIIEYSMPRKVRMANLAIIGSFSVNGVSALHTEILKNSIFSDFYHIWPDKFNNKTNGITPRRWLKKSNKLLAHLITEKIGDNWVTDLSQLSKLKNFLDDEDFKTTWRETKWYAKHHLAQYIKKNYNITVDPSSIFDVQVKRLHEYKRQLLNVLHIISLYNRIKENPNGKFTPRTILFAGKSAPGYFMSKLIIKLINSVADTINNDPQVFKHLKVIFLKNYSVSLAEKIIPAADLSEQISTAGYEASGTGNMKFMLNGALTIGTMDGANVEMAQEVGKENMFIFGMSANEVVELKKHGYMSQDYYEKDEELKKIIDMIRDDYFNKNEPGLFQPIYNSLITYGDTYCLLADFRSYIEAQKRVDEEYLNIDLWTRKSILNTAASGKFSSDRTILEYVKEIWKVEQFKIVEKK